MILVEIQCDQQDERARGRAPCASRCNANPSGVARSPQGAVNNAKHAAMARGWVRRIVTRDGRRMGWVCKNCDALLSADRKGAR